LIDGIWQNMASRQSSDFRQRTDSIPLPRPVIIQVLPEIRDLSELKAILYIVYIINEKCEQPRYVSYKELLAHELMASVGETALRQGLKLALAHGVLSHSSADINGEKEDIYFTKDDSHIASNLNIFTLYEQNIGMITPMIAEELKEAENLYPPQWIEEAFKEAVTLNKRSWKYIARILERWASEGKDIGEHRGNIKKGGPDKYIKGKYGHLVKR